MNFNAYPGLFDEDAPDPFQNGDSPGSYFSLSDSLGDDRPNRRNDAIKVETILGNTGYIDLSKTDGPLGYWGDRQDKAVRKWQDDNGLEVDGVLKPGGPTISSMKKATGSLLGGFTAPTADEVDQHHAQRQQGEHGLLNIRPARLSMPKPAQPIELDETSLAFNRDSANALAGSTVDGQIPDIYGNYLSQAGAAAHPTIMDLAEQVNAASGRDRADRVLHGIIGNASAAQVEGLLGGPQPARRPIGVKLAELADDGESPPDDEQ